MAPTRPPASDRPEFSNSRTDSTNSHAQTSMSGVLKLDQKDARLKTRYGSHRRLAIAVRDRARKLINCKSAALGSSPQFRFSKFRLRSSEAGSRQSTMANKSRFHWLRAGAGPCLAAFVVLCFSCSSSFRHGAVLPLTELHGSLDPLRNAFNEDVGKVRLMLLLDPT